MPVAVNNAGALRRGFSTVLKVVGISSCFGRQRFEQIDAYFPPTVTLPDSESGDYPAPPIGTVMPLW